MRFFLRSVFLPFLLLTAVGLKAQECPQVFNPVVAPDGRTFLNACYAETAGVNFFTQGVAFSSCINPALINPSRTCSQDYQPVVGCNGAVYPNICEAEKHGVTSYMPQGAYAMSNGDLETCFDYQRIPMAFPGAINYGTGLVSINCSTPSADPVCGCNGIQYSNPCEAEASGVLDYTYGQCALTTCIDTKAINTGEPENCPLRFNPVCGCNDMTYINQCAATASGVQATSAGTCAATAWQAKAQVLAPGEMRDGSISPASGNDISQYSCTSAPLVGYENVYVIHKTAPGDLQVEMEIKTPDADLDIFLLNGMRVPVCLGMSVGPPNQSLETIIMKDAPIGTYFIVVDAQYQTIVGDYSLQVATGYLDTEEIVEVTCGVPMSTSNAGGDNDLISFNCGQQRTASGREMVYSFTTNQAGLVTVDLFNQTAPMELYLLDALNRVNCIEMSMNPGNTPESISATLAAGTYYIVVDGDNGAVGDYMLNVSCPQACSINASGIAANSECDQNTGIIDINVQQANSNFLYLLDGPVSNDGGSDAPNYTFQNLPPGMYTLTVLDMYGCMSEQEIPVYQGDMNFMFTASVVNNQIQCNMTGGVPPYQISMNGTLVGTTSNSTYFIPITSTGQHEILVTDSRTCAQKQMLTSAPLCGIAVTATGSSASCTSTGSIAVDVINGTAPYNVTVNGTAYGPYMQASFTIPNLAAGNYNVSVMDGGGCTAVAPATISNSGGNLAINATGNAASCSTTGSITVTATSGTAPFTATINGAPAGTFNSSPFTITNINPGTYTLDVTDANTCSTSQSVTVGGSTNNLTINSATATDQACSTPGSISVNLSGGTGSYTATLSGAAAGTYTTSPFTIPSIGAGTYLLEITDGGGCMAQTSVTVGNSGNNLNLNATPTAASCSSAGSIAVDVVGGTTGPYSATLNGVAIGGSFPNNWFTLQNVTAGTYTLVVIDVNGCTGVSQVTVANSGGNISLSPTPSPASCGSNGSISVDVIGGTGPYSATLNGVPAGGPFVNNWFNLPNVPAGTYTLAVTDGNGCIGTSQVTVANSGGNISFTATPTGAGCSSTGSIAVDVTGGTAPYSATLNGAPAGGPFPNNWFTLQNVGAGTYTLVITDGNGCTGSQQVTVANSGGNISFTATPTGAGCGSTGSIAVDVTGGTAPYSATLNGAPAGGPFTNNWFTLQNVGAGTYTLVITDGNGCTSSQQVTISNLGGGSLTVNATANAAGCGSTGSIAVDVIGGAPNYSATLNGVPAGGPFANNWFSLTNVPAGNYTLVITDGNGCTGTTNIIVSGGGSGNVNLTATSSPASCGSTGSIQLDIAGGTAPFDVFLDGNLVTNTTNRWYVIQNVAAGSHTVRVVDANGCEDTTTSIIGGGSGGNFTVTTTVSGGGCGSNATVGVDVIGSTPPYTVTLNGNNVGTANQNWFNITGVPAGTYTLVLTNSSGCTGTTQVTVNGGGSGNLNVTASTNSAGCGSTGSIQLDIAGGTAPFDVYVDGNLVVSNTTNRWYIIQNLAAGTYSVRVVDANGCEDTIVKTVSGNGGGFTITTSPSAASCGGLGSIGVDVIGGTPTFTVRLNGNIVGTSNQTWFEVVNVPAGTYTLEVTDANGCTATNQVTVNGGGSSNLNVTGSSTTASCNSSATTQLDIQGGVAPFDIFLDGTLVTNTTNRWYVIQNVTAGAHTVEVVDANGCSDIYKYNVSGSGGNLSVTATSSAASCSSLGMIQLDIQGGNPPFQIDLDGNFVTITTNRWYVIQNVTAGNHEIEITDLNGCSTIIWEDVSGTSGNLSATATSTAASCNTPGSIQLDIQGGVEPFDIEVDGNFVANTNNRWYEILNIAAGSREIKITDKNGCSITIWETVGGGSNLTFTTTPTGAMCSTGGTIQLDITGGDGPFDVELDGNLVTNTNDRWYEILNVGQGSHTVTVTDKNGCTSTRTQNVSGSNGNIILTATHTPGTCAGGGKIMLDIQGGMGPFDVVMDGVFIINTTDRWYTITNVGSGTHNIEITDKNGCTATTVEVVSGSNGFSLVGDVTQGTCGFNKGQIDITISGGTAPFDVFFDGVLKANTSVRFHNWTNLAPGTYLVEVIDKTGCSRTFTGTINNTVGAQFTSTITSAGCNGNDGSVKIDITSGDAPFDIWLDGNVITSITGTTYTYTNLAAGDYQIGVEDANGCEVAEDITISGAASVSVSATSTDASCGATDGTIAVAIAGGTAPYEIFVDGVSTATTSDLTYTIDGLAPGTYEVKIVDKNGCTDLTIEKIRGNGTNITLDVTTTDAGCGSTGSIKMDILTGDAPFTISLDGNVVATTSDATYTIDGLAPGDYDVQVESANGCDESFSRTIGGTTANIVLTGTTTACGCGATDGKISLDMVGGTSPYDIFVDGVLVGSTIANDFTVTNLAPGDYDVKVVDKNGCDAAASYNVQLAPGVSITTNSTACGCNGLTGSISVDLTGGTAPYDIFLDGTYITSTFNSIYTIAGLGQGTYTVKAVDANNCDASVTETVQHFSDLDFTTTVTDAACGSMNGEVTVNISAGSAPYQIYLNGNLVTTTSDPRYTITGLAGGSYLIRVSDVNTCDKTASVTVNGSSSNMTINATASPENCGAMDGNIAVDIIGGDPDFEIYLDGVLLTTISDRWYDAMGLTVGTYVLRVVDRNGCEVIETLTVTGNTSINTSTSATNSSCGNTNGTITVDNTGGLAPYVIFLDGNNVGSTFNQLFTIAGLAPGMYDIRVEDANGCFAEVTETVNGGGSLAFSTDITAEACGMLGSVAVNISTGTAPFDIFVDGNLATTTSNNSATVTDLSSGNYEIRVKDAGGCESIQTIFVRSAPTLDFEVTAMPDTCGGNGSALVEFLSGTAPYTISLDGNVIATTSDNNYTIDNLSSGGYIVKVADSQGCTDEIVVMMNNTNNQPSAGFTYMFRPGGVVKFFANNVNGTVAWDFDDGTTSTELNPIHTFDVDSTYKVCIQATNGCGTSDFCEVLNIPSVYSSNLSFNVADVDGRPGEIVEVPVTVDNFDRVTRFQFSMKVGSGAYARMIEVDEGNMTNFESHIMNDETITVTWESDSADGTTMANGETIFTMKLELMGDRGDCTPIDFVTNPMTIQVMQKWFAQPTLVLPNFFAGQVCINEMVSVSGNVHREDQRSIPDVEITCNGSQTIMTDPTTGEFTFPTVGMGDNCLLLPEKDGDDRMALTVKDLLAIRAHILETQNLNSPYKIIAADMDRNQRLDGNDLSVLADLILANQSSMISGDSWRFIPSNHIFDNPTDPFSSVFPVMIDLRGLDHDMTDNDFTGMKLGDVDYSLNLNTMHDTDYNMTDNVMFETVDQSVTAGEEFEMNITSGNFNNIRGFQFELSFDTDKFEFAGMVPGTLIGLDHNMVGTDQLNDGILPILWYDRDLIANGVSRADDEVLFRLKFRAKEDASTLESSFELGKTLVHDLAVNVFDQNLDIYFMVGDAVSAVGEQEEAQFVLHQNFPNPFSLETTIAFELPTPQDVRLELIDQTGKTVQVKEGFFPQGAQQMIVRGDELPVSGIYFYRLTVGEKSETNKLIFIQR